MCLEQDLARKLDELGGIGGPLENVLHQQRSLKTSIQASSSWPIC